MKGEVLAKKSKRKAGALGAWYIYGVCVCVGNNISISCILFNMLSTITGNRRF